MSEEVDKLWLKAARTIVKAGQMPIPITNTLITLLQTIMTHKQAQFIQIFKKPSLNFDQIKEKSNLDDKSLHQMLNELMENGIVVGVLSRRTGIMVYRLLGPFPGLFEYTNLRGETDEKHKKIAKLFEILFKEMQEGTQGNYAALTEQFKNFPALTRIIPVEEEIEEVPIEKVIPLEEVSKIIDKYDDIAVAHCYCRHQQDLLGKSCKTTDERSNCFLLGKSAQFAIEYKFANPISKENAKKIMNKASDEGLVHKAFHVHLNPELEEEAVCNCCSCCCGPFQLYYNGVMPFHTLTSYQAELDETKCIGCGNCIEICPMETIDMNNTIVKINLDKCIGCGVCVHHCPEKAIYLKRIGPRDVFLPPKKVRVN
ncbi:MAG: indolepyruvate ferredoxin oxidoreductase subunit alpha [Candidatus Thorarchaeota archaeon]